MDPAAYLDMADAESRHWWFLGRRAIIANLIRRLDLPNNPRILELGCGTGGNLAMLGAFGHVSALEMDRNALAIATTKTANAYDIRPGRCPDMIPFAGERFDLICMFDVLEHIGEDVETLMAVRQLLADDGRVLITVPAYQWLWSGHDEFLHHKRRYSLAALRRKAVAAGLAPVRLSYFNTLLFPLAALMRLADRFLPKTSAGARNVPPSWMNSAFRSVFAGERFLLDRFDLPFGVSLFCVLQNAGSRRA